MVYCSPFPCPVGSLGQWNGGHNISSPCHILCLEESDVDRGGYCYKLANTDSFFVDLHSPLYLFSLCTVSFMYVGCLSQSLNLFYQGPKAGYIPLVISNQPPQAYFYRGSSVLIIPCLHFQGLSHLILIFLGAPATDQVFFNSFHTMVSC